MMFLRAYLKISQARHGKQSARIWKAGPKTKSATTPLLNVHLKPILLNVQQTVQLAQNLENTLFQLHQYNMWGI